uniref:F-box domain-containing protein n=1 Tax=Hordeum vulgare subsp. vulgare TaxID=112509 RepID=A0A8I7BFL4_HORVV
MEETAAATGVTSLPEDAIREILVRLEDAPTLFRCAVTCRQWCRLVSDASFLRRCWPDDQATWSTFLAGFFALKRLDRTDPTFVPGVATFATFFVPTPWSVFGPSSRRRSLSSFFPDIDPCIFDHALPLAARRGLLLVRIGVHGDSGYQYRLAACNLLAAACDVLPALLTDGLDFGRSGYAILTAADCSPDKQHLSSAAPGYSTLFKVLVLGIMYPNLNLYTYSSSEGGWSKPTQITTFGPYGEIRDCKHLDVVVSRRKAHWRVGSWPAYYFLDVDAETDHISRRTITSSSNYSRAYGEPQLRVTANGTLSVLFRSMSRAGLEIYTLEDDEKSGNGATITWLSAGTIVLKPPRHMKRTQTPTFLRLLGEKSGTMLLKDWQKQIFMADLETGVTEKLTGCFDGLNRHKLILMEMDWLVLFVSRLGKWLG